MFVCVRTVGCCDDGVGFVLVVGACGFPTFDDDDGGGVAGVVDDIALDIIKNRPPGNVVYVKSCHYYTERRSDDDVGVSALIVGDSSSDLTVGGGISIDCWCFSRCFF